MTELKPLMSLGREHIDDETSWRKTLGVIVKNRSDGDKVRDLLKIRNKRKMNEIIRFQIY